MTTEQKKEKIRELVMELLSRSQNEMVKNLDKVLNRGAVSISSWDMDEAPMIIPKCIAIALLEYESKQYSPYGTSLERKVKKEVRNIKYFI